MINKKLNTNLQATISRENSAKLNEINNYLNNCFNMKFTKSQTINFLISTYELKNIKHETTHETKELKYQNQLKTLKNNLGFSIPMMAQYLDISESTLKKYLNGLQNPTKDNETKIIKALKENNII